MMCRKLCCCCWAGEEQFTIILAFVSNIITCKCQVGILLALLAIFTVGKINSPVVFRSFKHFPKKKKKSFVWNNFLASAGKGKVRGVHFYQEGSMKS